MQGKLLRKHAESEYMRVVEAYGAKERNTRACRTGVTALPLLCLRLRVAEIAHHSIPRMG